MATVIDAHFRPDGFGHIDALEVEHVEHQNGDISKFLRVGHAFAGDQLGNFFEQLDGTGLGCAAGDDPICPFSNQALQLCDIAGRVPRLLRRRCRGLRRGKRHWQGARIQRTGR